MNQEQTISLKRAVTKLLGKNKQLKKENAHLRQSKAQWESKANIYHRALVNQGVQPVWACSCFRDCSCLEQSLKLI